MTIQKKTDCAALSFGQFVFKFMRDSSLRNCCQNFVLTLEKLRVIKKSIILLVFSISLKKETRDRDGIVWIPWLRGFILLFSPEESLKPLVEMSDQDTKRLEFRPKDPANSATLRFYNYLITVGCSLVKHTHSCLVYCLNLHVGFDIVPI